MYSIISRCFKGATTLVLLFLALNLTAIGALLLQHAWFLQAISDGRQIAVNSGGLSFTVRALGVD